MTKSTPAGVAGNVSRKRVHLRDWASSSYSSRDGRAASAVFDEGQSGQGWTRAENVSDQIPSGFEGRDRRATQGGPVKNRPVTQTVVDK